MREKIRRLRERYQVALHGMQAGVQALLDWERRPPSSGGGGNPDAITIDCTPKQLRVGVNSAMVDTGAIGDLLVRKGIITEDELWEALAAAAEREHKAYEARCSATLGAKVTLV